MKPKEPVRNAAIILGLAQVAVAVALALRWIDPGQAAGVQAALVVATGAGSQVVRAHVTPFEPTVEATK